MRVTSHESRLLDGRTCNAFSNSTIPSACWYSATTSQTAHPVMPSTKIQLYTSFAVALKNGRRITSTGRAAARAAQLKRGAPPEDSEHDERALSLTVGHRFQ